MPNESSPHSPVIFAYCQGRRYGAGSETARYMKELNVQADIRLTPTKK